MSAPAQPGRLYAQTIRLGTGSDARKTAITMHRLIVGAKKDVVDHRNGDTLDNRRANAAARKHFGEFAALNFPDAGPQSERGAA